MVGTYTLTPSVSESMGRSASNFSSSVSQGDSGPIRVGASSGSRLRRVYVPLLANIALRITNLLTWPKEWDGYRMAPTREAVKHAFSWIKRLHQEVSERGELWLDPLIVADAFGNVVFEWWEGHKKLTVYVTPNGAEYVKVWGPDIFSDMDDGDIEGVEDRRALWHWLMG